MSLNESGPPFFLKKDQYELIADIAEAIVPSGPDPLKEPGARQVGAVNYADSVLLASEPDEVKMIEDLLEHIRSEAEKLGKSDFRSLSEQQKITLLNSLHDRSETKSAYIFLRALCVEGFYSDYSDPGYEGVTAWNLLEFGGPRISDLEKDWSFLEIHARKKKEGNNGESL